MANLSQAQKDFISDAYSWAEKAGLSGTVADLAVAQAAHESAYGRRFTGNNNFFGMKGPGTKSRTHEIVDGRRVNIIDDFRNFATPEESFRQWAGMMSRMYPGVLTANTMHEAIGGLNINIPQKPSYATDTDYETRMFEYMDRLDELGYDLGLNDIVAPYPTERGVSQQTDLVRRQTLDPHSGNMGLVERQEPAWSDQFAPGPIAAPKSAIPHPVRNEYPTGPTNPEPWQDKYAPAPQYAHRTASPARFDKTFAPSDPQAPPLTPGTSNTGKAAAYRGLADTMRQAGLGGLDGRAVTQSQAGIDRHGPVHPAHGLSPPPPDPAAPRSTLDSDSVPIPRARPPVSARPEFTPPVPKSRPQSMVPTPTAPPFVPAPSTVPIPTPRPATHSALPMMPLHRTQMQQRPSPYTGPKKQIFDFVLRQLMNPNPDPK